MKKINDLEKLQGKYDRLKKRDQAKKNRVEFLEQQVSSILVKHDQSQARVYELISEVSDLKETHFADRMAIHKKLSHAESANVSLNSTISELQENLAKMKGGAIMAETLMLDVVDKLTNKI